jgi:N-acetylglucosaminyl-diphospho-decaprenol L-rhamnosyltransferase
MADVRVGIVSWNTAGLLDRCLAALPAALAGLDADIVVVDNASSDASPEVVSRHANVRLVLNDTNVGYARAMNQALTAFGGTASRVFIALNPDTEPGPETLAELVRRLLADDRVGLVAPRLLNLDGCDQHSVYRFPSPAVAAAVSFLPRRYQRRGVGARFWLEGFSDHRQTVDVDWAIGAVHVIRSAAVGSRSPYSERWFMYVEDLELCWRLARDGWRRRLCGDIAIAHVGNAAGAQQWGETRTAQWLEATYDWYREAKGRMAMTGWGVVNLAGLCWLIGCRGLVWLCRPSARAAATAEARRFVRVVPQHARILVFGPRIPSAPNAGAGTDGVARSGSGRG